MDTFVYKDHKKLRCGYTTGTCAALAAQGAVRFLLTGSWKETEEIMTPKGIPVCVSLEEKTSGDSWAECAVRKDAGDDYDVTNGILVYARAEFVKDKNFYEKVQMSHLESSGFGAAGEKPGLSPENQKQQKKANAAHQKEALPESLVRIDGGIGIGRITKSGLDQPVGAAAINSVPRKMIRDAVYELLEEAGKPYSLHIFENEALKPDEETIGSAVMHFDHSCDAVIAVPAGKEADLEQFIRGFDATLKNEYAGCDAGVTLECAKTEAASAVSAETTSVMLHTLFALPQGVEAMSADFPGLVQTSLNLGVMHLTEDGLHFSYSIRSCIASQKAMLAQRVHAIVEFAGGTVSERGNYPGWQYERDSKLRELVLGVYRDLTGAEAKLEATHGGLECGLFIEKIPGLDAISLGPELHDVHSVRERLSVPSTERVYELVCEVLRRSR